MKIYVLRHCTTEYSLKKIYCGKTDIPLSEEGRVEAERLGASLKDSGIDIVFTSPLLRARETAETVAAGLPIVCDERLAERDFGDFEQTSVAREDGKKYRFSFALRYPNGESYLDVAARIGSFLGELQEKYADKTPLLVSHGSACRVLRAYLLPMTDEEFYAYSQPNGAVEEYEL